MIKKTARLMGYDRITADLEGSDALTLIRTITELMISEEAPINRPQAGFGKLVLTRGASRDASHAAVTSKMLIVAKIMMDEIGGNHAFECWSPRLSSRVATWCNRGGRLDVEFHTFQLASF